MASSKYVNAFESNAMHSAIRIQRRLTASAHQRPFTIATTAVWCLLGDDQPRCCSRSRLGICECLINTQSEGRIMVTFVLCQVRNRLTLCLIASPGRPQ